MNLSHDLSTMIQPSIMAIKVISSNKVYLTQSNNPLISVGRILQQIRDSKHPIKDLNVDLSDIEILYIESINDRKDGQIKLQQSINHYTEMGFKVLNRRPSINYKIDIQYINSKVHIYLKSSNQSRLLVGVFNKQREAIQFLSANYPNQNKVLSIIYSTNLATREYRDRCKLDNKSENDI